MSLHFIPLTLYYSLSLLLLHTTYSLFFSFTFHSSHPIISTFIIPSFIIPSSHYGNTNRVSHIYFYFIITKILSLNIKYLILNYISIQTKFSITKFCSQNNSSFSIIKDISITQNQILIKCFFKFEHLFNSILSIHFY